jgi:hypothetical protein
MSKQQYFPTTTIMYQRLKDLRPEFSINNSLSMTRFSFADTEGKQFLAYTIPDFCEKFNERFGETLCPRTSIIAGKNSYLIQFTEMGDSPEKEVVKEPVVVAEPEVTTVVEPEEVTMVEPVDVVEDVIESEDELISLTPPTEEAVVTEDVEKVVADKEPDWDWIATLTNSSPSKKSLDEYAEKEFDVSLNRRNTLDNMIADFKDQLTSK